ncbi:MAG: antitoxin VapB family protein [Tepidisphaeraceae bacterium]
MATKTISITVSAYDRLKRVQKPNESFSETIERITPKPVDLDALFVRMTKDPLSDRAVAAIERQIARRSAPRNIPSLTVESY